MEVLDARLQALGTRGIIATIIILWIVVIVSDLTTGPQLSFTLFYLMPIGLAAWYLGWRGGWAMALVGTLAWFLCDLLNGIVWTSQLVRYWNTAVRGGVFLVVAYAISMLSEQLEHEKELARTDALTGLSNWREFAELAVRELARARRYKTPVTLAYFDVDNFKTINDTLGHEAGNTFLREIALVLKQAFRITDVIARMGGDEFVVLLPDQSQDGAEVAISKVRSELAALCAQYQARPGFSIGVVTAIVAPTHVEDLVKVADNLMYEVKGEGKSGCRFALFAADRSETAGVD